jgi:hypothetical protein
MFKKFLWLVAIIIVVIAIIIGGAYFDLWFKGTFGVAKQNVETQIYTQTKSFVEGATRDLMNYRLELMKTEDESERKAIINLIIRSNVY